MGREAQIDFIAGRETARVKAHLDSAALQLTGGKRLTVPLASVRSAVADGGDLTIVTPQTRFTLRLGAKEAAAWAKKILNPPSLADKLGLKDGLAVLLIGGRIDEIEKALPKSTSVTHAATVSAAKAKLGAVALLTLKPASAEKDIAAAAKVLGEKTQLWLVYTKGTKPNGDDIIRIARAAGLKDTKVARVSETHAALRFIRAKS